MGSQVEKRMGKQGAQDRTMVCPQSFQIANATSPRRLHCCRESWGRGSSGKHGKGVLGCGAKGRAAQLARFVEERANQIGVVLAHVVDEEEEAGSGAKVVEN